MKEFPGIKSLRLINFKTHADTFVEFGRFTQITGKNSAGKTNLFRALNLVLFNGDWPVHYLRHGTDSGSIEVVLSDGVVLKRSRTKTKQTFTIVDEAGRLVEFDGKRDVERVIEQYTGLAKVVFDEVAGPKNINIIPAGSGNYIIGARPDTVMREISAIIGGNEIEEAKRRMAKQAKLLGEKIEFTTEQLAGAKESLTTVKTTLSDLRPVYERLCADRQLRAAKEARLAGLVGAKNVLKQTRRAAENHRIIEQLSERLAKLETRIQLLSDRKRRLSSLKGLSFLVDRLHLDVPTEEDVSVLVTAPISSLECLVNELSLLLGIREKLQLTMSNAKAVEDKLSEVTKQLAYKKRELQRTTSEDDAGFCPTCGRAYDA